MIACLIAILISGNLEQHLVTGVLVKENDSTYTVDVSNGVLGLGNVEGDYTGVIVNKDDCIKKK